MNDQSPAQLLYPDLDRELSVARTTLERVPDAQAGYVPHEKSMNLGRLGAHLVELMGFATSIASRDELDFAKGEYATVPFESTEQLLAGFDAGAAKLRAAVQALTWEDVGRTWTLRAGPQVMMAAPRAVALRMAGISHLVHHRAQLGVYLRLLGVPVPGTYGPSADEQ
ncbi:DinB family protein [Roseisolibacter sp. H3M3-2]|uniref:DinB family protein n=1 Tax=Roseisolibacter sp. H3M3-2 TaxID=3031323 RepID=UPI0023DC32CE|nr:DinB family protein [Roseisolibacter sp. H3M3-2]MDF1505943.1 DinB family protein [Roseisolibacter sp. H3M3-2]